jgi:hypothetical protein
VLNSFPNHDNTSFVSQTETLANFQVYSKVRK